MHGTAPAEAPPLTRSGFLSDRARCDSDFHFLPPSIHLMACSSRMAGIPARSVLPCSGSCSYGCFRSSASRCHSPGSGTSSLCSFSAVMSIDACCKICCPPAVECVVTAAKKINVVHNRYVLIKAFSSSPASTYLRNISAQAWLSLSAL